MNEILKKWGSIVPIKPGVDLAQMVRGGKTSTHLHEFHNQYIFAVDGEVRVTLKKEVLTIIPGELVCIPAGIKHQLYAVKKSKIYELYVPTSTNHRPDIVRLETI